MKPNDTTRHTRVLPALLALLLGWLLVGHLWAAERVTYYHTDAQGSVVAATDETGAVLWRQSYRPYGERMEPVQASADERLFYTGKPYEVETGLIELGARDYDPLLGRFIAMDPVEPDPENPHSFNRYAYGNNNPYRYIDPDGKWPLHSDAFQRCQSLGQSVEYNAPMEVGLKFGALSWGALAASEYSFLLATTVGLEPATSAAKKAIFETTKGLQIAPRKFDYLFGRVSSNAHNAARSNQLALQMKRLGVPDNAAGRRMLTEHLTLSAQAEGNVVRTFSNQYGNFEVRESLFMGPSGKAAKFESTFQVLEDGTRRLSTVIPFH